jgi:hypothetical protein
MSARHSIGDAAFPATLESEIKGSEIAASCNHPIALSAIAWWRFCQPRTFPFFRADQLTAILLSGLTIAVIVARLGDDDSRSQHDHNSRADDRINGEQGKGGKRSVRKALYAMKSFRNDPVAAQEKATEIVEMIEELNQNIINLHNALLKQRQKADKEATAKVGKAKTKSKAKTKRAPRMVK